MIIRIVRNDEGLDIESFAGVLDAGVKMEQPVQPDRSDNLCGQSSDMSELNISTFAVQPGVDPHKRAESDTGDVIEFREIQNNFAAAGLHFVPDAVEQVAGRIIIQFTRDAENKDIVVCTSVISRVVDHR